jgi:cell fate regulator YaaT (PSP1 superfamily)
MGCTGCSTKSGASDGSKGGCSSGGCGKLDVYDWFSNMTLAPGVSEYDIVEVRFKNGRKVFYRNTANLPLQVGDTVVTEANPGYDVGVVTIVGELMRLQIKRKTNNFKPHEAKKILRKANEHEMELWKEACALEKPLMLDARKLANNLKLDMKISDVEYQGDKTKATFYYTAESRIDFRQLIKDMADKFKVRIEMRQIGARQESARLGGIGPCGRELCCSTWLTDFRSVSTSAARYQQLSLNPQKLAGLCGKLKCCLNYELDMYLEALKELPSANTRIKTAKGNARHVKTDVFKRMLWFAYDNSEEAGPNNLFALEASKVKEIVEANKNGNLKVEIEEFEEKAEEKVTEYFSVVGQESLNRFDDKFKKNKKKKKKKRPQGETNNQLQRDAKPIEKQQNDNKSAVKPQDKNPASGLKKNKKQKEKKPLQITLKNKKEDQ